MLPTKFRVNWIFSSSSEGKNRFSRWPPSWILDWNNFNYFYIYKSSRCFLPIFKSTGPLVQENKRKKEFQEPWWPSWISNPNNLSYFWCTSHPKASYQVSSQMAFHESSGKEAKYRFSRWLPWRPQCSSQEFLFWGPGAPTLQKVGDIWKNLGTVQSMIKIL